MEIDKGGITKKGNRDSLKSKKPCACIAKVSNLKLYHEKRRIVNNRLIKARCSKKNEEIFSSVSMSRLELYLKGILSECRLKAMFAVLVE